MKPMPLPHVQSEICHLTAGHSEGCSRTGDRRQDSCRHRSSVRCLDHSWRLSSTVKCVDRSTAKCVDMPLRIGSRVFCGLNVPLCLRLCRLTTTKDCDNIYVLDHGMVAEQAHKQDNKDSLTAHEQLLDEASGANPLGLYQKLWAPYAAMDL
eukprot:SAG31_NODE_422_length_15859_cov_5.161865_2_plen_152_part_00